MSKHIHISISDVIGEQTDDFGFVYPGFMAYMIEWPIGFNYETGEINTTGLEKVTLHINSPGGSVTEGFAIHNKLLALREKGVQVEVIIEGECYSIATCVALAASPGLLKMRAASMWMVHSPWGMQVGNADELRKYAEYLEAHEKPMVAMYVAKTGKTEEEITALLKEERFMSAEAAKAYGFIDEVITTPLPATVQARSAGMKAVAFYTPSNNTNTNTTMTEKEKEGFGAIVASAIASAFTAFGFKPKAEAEGESTESTEPKALSVALEDGTEIHFEGEELAQGTSVFADAELTEALADGEYVLADGRTIEVVEGAVANISEVEETEEEETETEPAAQAEPNALALLEKKVLAMEKAAKADKAQIKALQDKVKAFVPGSGNTGAKPAQQFAEKQQGKAHPLDSVAANAKIKK